MSRLGARCLHVMLATALAVSGTNSQACAWHGDTGHPFREALPGSLAVAVAARQAMLDGQLYDASNLSPDDALQRAEHFMQVLARELVMQGPVPVYRILLVDQVLWSAVFSQRTDPLTLQFHLEPEALLAQPLLLSAPTILLTADVLESLLRDRLTLAQARNMGLLTVSFPATRSVEGRVLQQRLQMLEDTLRFDREPL